MIQVPTIVNSLVCFDLRLHCRFMSFAVNVTCFRGTGFSKEQWHTKNAANHTAPKSATIRLWARSFPLIWKDNKLHRSSEGIGIPVLKFPVLTQYRLLPIGKTESNNQPITGVFDAWGQQHHVMPRSLTVMHDQHWYFSGPILNELPHRQNRLLQNFNSAPWPWLVFHHWPSRAIHAALKSPWEPTNSEVPY